MSDEKKILGTIQAMIDAQAERDLGMPHPIKPRQIIIPDSMMEGVREFGKLLTAAAKLIETTNTGCDHAKEWGSLTMNGIKVFSSPHLPPDTMLVIDEPVMKDVWPALSMQFPNDPWHYMMTAPRPMPDFGPLLHATQQTILNQNRGRFNVVICPDDSPFLPTHKSMCAVCKMYVEMGCLHMRCQACEDHFRNLQARQRTKLKDFALRHFFAELNRRGKQWPTNQPLPEFLFSRRQSKDRKTLNASMKRRKRRQKIASAKALALRDITKKAQNKTLHSTP